MVLYNVNEFVPMFGFNLIGMQTDALKRIRDGCGVSVDLELVYWHTVEKKIGEYDWATLDKQVKRNTDAGLRLMIMCCGVPHCLPQKLYATTASGCAYQEILSFWNDDAIAYTQNYLQAVIDRYGGEDVTVIWHGFLGGEQYLWNAPVYYDTAARADWKAKYGDDIPKRGGGAHLDPQMKEWLTQGIIKHQVAVHDVLIKQHNETWDATQYLIGLQSDSNGNFARFDVLSAYRDRWPDATRMVMQYTYLGNTVHGNSEVVDRLVTELDCKLVVEANYCGGLLGPPTNPVPSPHIILDGGFNKIKPENWCGQVISPLHPFRGYKVMEPWMMTALKWAVDEWRLVRDEGMEKSCPLA